MKIDALLSRLEKVRKQGKGHIACCPAHPDRSPSLSIAEAPDGRVLIHCFAGCTVHDVLAAVGMTIHDVMPERIADYLPSAYARQKPKLEQTERDELFILQCKRALERRERLTPETLKALRAATERVRRKGGAHA